MVSKELLVSVLGYPIKGFEMSEDTPTNIIIYLLSQDDAGRNGIPWDASMTGVNSMIYYNVLDIYRLSYMIKEWAWDNGYQIRSSFKSVTMDSKPYGELIDCTAIDTGEGIYYSMVATYGAEDDENEIDVIIRLGEWVLERLKK